MKSFRLLQIGCCCLAVVMIGCGGTEVVNVDRSDAESSGGGGYSGGGNGKTESRPATGDSRSGRDRSAGTSQSNSQSSNTQADSTDVAAGPRAMIPADSSPSTGNGVATPTDFPTDTPEVDPVPPPSDYRVMLSDGRTLDIGDLLGTQVREFEERLALISKGKNMIRTYYMSETEPAGAAAGGGPIPPDVSNPASTRGSYTVPGTAPTTPQRPPTGFQPQPSSPTGIRRPFRRRTTGRGGFTPSPSQPRRSTVAPQQQQQQIDKSLPFMNIGRIASTMRGPMAAYYRNRRPMIYVSYNRDSKRDDTLISWDEAGRPLVVDQYSNGRRNGLRVLFRPRAENDPTGVVVLVQEWRAGKLTTTHVAAEDGTAETIAPADIPSTETNDQLIDRVAELDQFDETLGENEREIRKALTAFNREQIRMAKAAKTAARQQQQAMAVQARQQILQQLQSGIQAPGSWRP
ncbi:MAG: hypothetical protein HOL01_02135 [Planctomycetaceae bacterium]|nr:hypothetical protein [Planctomycetaceae bacterium]